MTNKPHRMDWLIREANPQDAETLALIGAATFLETFAAVHTGPEIVAHCRDHHSPAAYARLLQPGTDAWLAETVATRAPVGYALLTPPSLPGTHPGDLELKRIYTLSILHGSGLGPELLRQATERARQRQAPRLLLDVWTGNTRALAFYRKHGFTEIATHPFLVGGTPYEDLVLAKPLQRTSPTP